MNRSFAVIEMRSGVVQCVDVYGTDHEAQVALFGCLKNYVSEHPVFRASLERCAGEVPDGKFGQFLQGLDGGRVESTVDAYEWLAREYWQENVEFVLIGCMTHEPRASEESSPEPCH